MVLKLKTKSKTHRLQMEVHVSPRRFAASVILFLVILGGVKNVPMELVLDESPPPAATLHIQD